MSRVVFQLDFTVQGVIELTSRASISNAEAVQIEGLMGSSEDTIIRIYDPALEQETANNFKKSNRNTASKHRGDMEVQPAQSQDRQEDDDEDVGEADLREIEHIQMEMEDRMIAQQMDDGEEGDEDEEGDEAGLQDLDDEEEEDAPQRDWQQMAVNYHQKKLTKRQMGYLQEPAQLPDKATRQKKKQVPEEDQTKRLERQQRRRQHMRKQAEAQKMQTLDRILNDAGRKQRQRTQRENKERADKENKAYRTLGEVPKAITRWNNEGCVVITHDTILFRPESLLPPKVPIRPDCYLCGGTGRYKVQGKRTVCSLTCYRKDKEALDGAATLMKK